MTLCLSKAQKTAKTTQKQSQLKPFQIVPTVHKDVTERLEEIDPSLAKRARVVLDVNKSERHIRGGMATREKYLHQHI
ncbi:MAG: stage III sporulation protein D [Lachnospiraceae bacterium]|nr:stage III sporulation protein D [Lachnospiraceae bacterium]